MLGVGKNAKFEMSGGELRTRPAKGRAEPKAGGRIIVLGEDAEGTEAGGKAGCEVSAEEEKVGGSHDTTKPAEEGKGVEVRQNAKEGKKGGAGGRDAAGERKVGGEIEGASRFFRSGQAADGTAGEGEVGIGREQGSGWGKFLEKKRFFSAVGTPKGNEVVGEGKMGADGGSGFLVKKTNGLAAKEGGVSEVDLAPETTEGGVRIESGGG